MMRLADAWTWDFWLADDGRPDGDWFMFYTGASAQERGLKQRVGLATSADLRHWSKHSGSPVLESDPRWYETLSDALWPGEAWRDPWVFADPDGDGWHMFLTARACAGPADQRGVIGHARSSDLVHWRAGRWVMLAFRNRGPDGRFVGELSDPMPVRWAADGTTLMPADAAALTGPAPGEPDHAEAPYRTGGPQWPR
jgi:hypothetical protein